MLKTVSRKNTWCEKWDGMVSVYGRDDLIPMWVADMDIAPPDTVTEAIISRAKHLAYGYTQEMPEESLAVRDWLSKRHGLATEPEDYVFSPGVMTSLRACVRALTCPGDGVLIQTPVYPPFMKMPAQLGRKVVVNPLKMDENGRYEMDFNHLETCLKDVKLMLLCSPHNPVGRVWSRDELLTLAKLCQKHGVIVAADEIHHDFVYSGHKHTPFLSLSDIAAEGLAVSCISATKTFNLAGLLQSTIVIKNNALRETIRHELACSGAGANIFGSLAQKTAYTTGEPWLLELLAFLEQSRDHAEKTISGFSGVSVSPLEGTYLMWLKFDGASPERLRDWSVNDVRVAFNFGETFGAGGAGFLRMNIACPIEQLDKTLERIADNLPKLF